MRTVSPKPRPGPGWTVHVDHEVVICLPAGLAWNKNINGVWNPVGFGRPKFAAEARNLALDEQRNDSNISSDPSFWSRWILFIRLDEPVANSLKTSQRRELRCQVSNLTLSQEASWTYPSKYPWMFLLGENGLLFGGLSPSATKHFAGKKNSSEAIYCG